LKPKNEQIWARSGLDLGLFWVKILVAALKIVNIRPEGVAFLKINVKLINIKWVKSAYVKQLCANRSEGVLR
jgi:hypothetical protein